MKHCEIHNLEKLDFSGTEALNSICTNLSFVGRNLKRFILTSCTENEGKSSMAFHIMRNLASRGKSVVLVDCDLRKSVMLARFSVQLEGEDALGVAHYLTGYSTLKDIIYESNVPGCYLIPVGQEVANPISLIDSPEFNTLIDNLAKNFDVVLLDAPPIGMVIDSAVMAKVCDGAVLVIEYGKRRKGEIADAAKKIRQSGCPILGCIINKVSVRTRSERKYYKNNYYTYSHYSKEGYGSGYGYGYGPKQGSQSGK